MRSSGKAGSALRAGFWIAICFTMVMALLPQPPQIPGEPTDKVLHVIAFAVLAALAAFAYPRGSLLRMLAGLSAFGALIELLQAIPGLNRSAEPLDWVADTIAAAAVLALAGAARVRKSRAAEREAGR